MKIIKRGQLAMLSIAFMIMIAGYINYKYNPEREENLGQTMHVNGKDVYLYSSNNNVDVYNDKSSAITDKNENLYNSKNNTSSLETFRISRDNMLSELEETYTQAISNSVTTEVAEKYQAKLNEIVKKKHTLAIVEGILKAKGISEVVIVPTEEKYNIMIKSKEKLSSAQIAMIQKIVEEEFNIEAGKINIIEQ